MPELGAAFLGKGDLNHFFHFPGTGVSSIFASTRAEETPRGGGEERSEEPRRVCSFYFFSKGFVINRKGCEAEIAESIPL